MTRPLPTPLMLGLTTAIGLAACGEREVNPPTQPARPIADGGGAAANTPTGRSGVLPGTGPTSFVGRWSADPAWCAAPQGDRVPIQITTTELIGYENRCRIHAIVQVAGAYEASLSCVGEGMSEARRVRFAVAGDVLTMTRLDRPDDPTSLTRCTALGDVLRAPTSTPAG